MNREELLGQISEDILTYVMQGEFPEHHFTQQIAPTELDERFHDYEMLVRLHFILRPDVVDFVESIPRHLRSIKTQTSNVSEESRGIVDGRINWSATTQERYSRNPGDKSLFVCDHRTENYDIDENIVLKRLLAVVYETLSECERYLEQDFDWVNERWKAETDLVAEMQDVYRRNVHLTRIRSPEEYEPTDRMVQRAFDSRQEVYRDAARLLSKYRDTLSGDPEAISELLDMTAIVPDDDETLFELFVLFRYISVIQEMAEGKFTLSTIEHGTQEVARLEGGNQSVVLYHDSAARNLQFISDVGDKDPDSLSRTEKIRYESRRIADQYFRDSEFKVVSGRPDVIVLEIEAGENIEYLITEVKYSSRQETVEQGIEELLEYLAYLRDDDEPVFSDPEIFGNGWNGVLVTNDIDDERTQPMNEQRVVRILQASELDSQLGDVVEKVL